MQMPQRQAKTNRHKTPISSEDDYGWRGQNLPVEALGTEGAQFDLVICDPPAFAPAKPALEAGLRAYERVARLAAPLVAPGGYLVLCSCSHAADLSAFRNASARGIGRGGRRGDRVRALPRGRRVVGAAPRRPRGKRPQSARHSKHGQARGRVSDVPG